MAAGIVAVQCCLDKVEIGVGNGAEPAYLIDNWRKYLMSNLELTTRKGVGKMRDAKKSGKRRAMRKVNAEQVFSPDLAVEVISDDFTVDEPTSCIVDEAPDVDALKDFGEPDRNDVRQAESGTSGRDGFVRYLASLADESLLTQEDEANLGREMAFGRETVRQTILENGIELIPLCDAINRLRAGESSIREIVDLDSFECGDELADRNLAVLELLKQFNVEATQYLTLIDACLDGSFDDTMLESRDGLRDSMTELGAQIPLQDSFITQIADTVVSLAASIQQDADNGDSDGASACTDEPCDSLDADAERTAYEAFGLNLSGLLPVADRIREGLDLWRSAQSRLVRSNLRLVVCIAKHYMRAGVPFEDMVQEGNMGLMRATEKFEYQRGTRFSTYSAFWIRHAIIKSIERQSRTIRLPGHIFEFSNRISNTAVAFQQKLGRPPTESEIADILGVSEQKVEEVAGYSHYSIVPLFADRDGEDELNLIDVLPNKSSVAPENYIEECEIANGLDKALDVLSEKERLVVELRNGLKDGHPHSLREVGQVLCLTRERIRQIEKTALDKIRVSGLADTLVAYA